VPGDIEQIEQGWNRRDFVGFLATFCCANTSRESVAKVLTLWIAAAPARNCSGSSAALTRAQCFLDGMALSA
jgi:hypothetical protein